jgi:uroporphyrinogen-III decarboxylase
VRTAASETQAAGPKPAVTASAAEPLLRDFLTAARGGSPECVPTALIIDSPWMPGFLGMNTLDFFLYPDAWLEAYQRVYARFPDVLFLPGFWLEYGMANEPTAFGTPILWRADSPPALRHIELPVERWRELARVDPERDGLMPLVLRRLELLERGGGLPEPHRIHFAAARGPLTLAQHVLGMTRFLEATLAEPEQACAVLEVFTDTVIAFLRAQLARLREPLGILLLDDVPGLLSPPSFEAIARPYLQRIFHAFPELLRIYHNDTPCPHLLSEIARLDFEVWNFSHEMDIALVKQALSPRIALMGNVAPLDVLARGDAGQVFEAARACVDKAAPGGGFILSAGGGVSPGTGAAQIDALVRAAARPA